MNKEFEEMPVVIFCGGMSTRIKSETLEKPKPMLTVGEYPLLWHIMKIYSHFGFKNFILTLGYKGDYVESFIRGEGKDMFSDFNIQMAHTGEKSGTGSRLKKIKDLINTEHFLCTYGDGLSDVNLRDVVVKHFENDALLTITSTFVPHKFGVVEYDAQGKLTDYKKGHLMDDPILAGFMVMSKAFIDYFDANDDDVMVEDPFNRVAKDGKAFVYEHPGFFGAVDTYKDLKELNDMWDKNPKWKIW